MINLKGLLNDCKSVLSISGEMTSDLLGFCHDTRNYQQPSFFVAYPGAKYNPLEHIGPILEKGCPVVVYSEDPNNEKLIYSYKEKFKYTAFVKVKDSITFTQELSSTHTKQWQNKGGYLFAISGSNGKTTHKEMLSFVLNQVFPGEVESTQKNNNNHLGVPFTLLQIKPQTKICILELGSNHPGEIKVLCDIANPQGGLVTNIGATHLEFFDNLENVFHEEAYLYQDLINKNPKKMFFLKNLDDEYLQTLPSAAGVKTFSQSTSDADFYFQINAPQVSVSEYKNTQILSNTHIAGNHNFSNLATAFVIAQHLFPAEKSKILKACSEFRPTFNRSQWQKILNIDVFLDAYNANPSSMKVALEGFFDEIKRHKIDESKVVLFIGDMNELGSESENYHIELGHFLKKWPLAKVVFIGRFSSLYSKGRPECLTFPYVKEIDSAKWREITNNATHAFIKGSRSLQLESLLAIT